MLQKSIEMICVHNLDGSIRPFKFKMRNESGENVTIQVKRIVDKREERQYLVWYCFCNVDGYGRTFEIKFFKQECKWYLSKII